jgi:BrnA antitoxin of type II toxin-antitoxin system
MLRWFKAHSPGYQTRLNAVLRAFVRARQRRNGRGHEGGRRARPSVMIERGRGCLPVWQLHHAHGICP